MNPKFSIVITTYNRSELLVRALNSLISQTENDWEAIVIDDGSTDDTSIRISVFLKRYPNIHYFKQAENSGAAMAKNLGIKMACGDYISFLDSDDEYEINHLAIRLKILNDNPNVDLLHGGVRIIGNEFVPDRQNPDKMIHLSDCKIGGTFFIKRESLKRTGYFDDVALGIDSDWFDKAAKACFEIMKINIPTYIYHREIQDSITHNFMKNIIHG